MSEWLLLVFVSVGMNVQLHAKEVPNEVNYTIIYSY